MSYIYLVPLQDFSAFKVGKSDRPIDRIKQLSAFYHFDLTKAFTMKCDSTGLAMQLESLIHAACSNHRIAFDYDGGTEFFNCVIYEQTLKLLNNIAELQGFEVVPFPILPLSMHASFIVSVDETKQIVSALVIKIKNKRLVLGLTQEQLANISGVSIRSIGNLERGVCSSLSTLVSVLVALDMDSLVYDFQQAISERRRVRKGLLAVSGTIVPPNEKQK
jgi:DNA-binding XRE family transcriptional regulator